MFTVLKNFWSACVEDIQCQNSFGEGSRCLTRCICRNEYHRANNACMKNKGKIKLTLIFLIWQSNKVKEKLLKIATTTHVFANKKNNSENSLTD